MTKEKEIVSKVHAIKKEFLGELVCVKNKSVKDTKKCKKDIDKNIKDAVSNDMNVNYEFSEALAKKLNKWIR